MAIRSGTAARLTPNDYDPQRQTLTFATKYDAHQSLKVTSELATILSQPGLNPEWPYVAQLSRGWGRGIVRAPQTINPRTLGYAFRHLARKLGITRRLTPHDLRRTTAVRVYETTQDLRKVQALLGHGDLGSTLWYLDHHLTTVEVEHLELAKLNPATEVVQ